MRTLETDYLVIGAGAMGMAFTDALTDHADVHVTIVDRRHGPGGHWRDAYPFVRLHQASQLYGVASTMLGDGAVQTDGPEAGLHERAGLPEILAYYDRVMERRFLPSGKVTFLAGNDHVADGEEHLVTSSLTGETVRIDVRRRVVDAAYLAPEIPATTPPPFRVTDGARVVSVNELASVAEAPGEFVIVGSGKTATDAIVWLLRNGVAPDQIVWVRPRDPWMLNRAAVQPDPAIMLELAARTMAAADGAASLDEVFLRLEDTGVMLRIDTGTLPTMARAPTLAAWELELLRSIERVVRLGHVRELRPGALVMDGGEVPLTPDAVTVHCAAAGLQHPPTVPIWGPDRIRLQTIRVGFPCFNAALAGYLEATREDDDERNRLGPPNVYANGLVDWARMQVRGARAAAVFSAEPDIVAWANGTALNPARLQPSQRGEPAVVAAADLLAQHGAAGLARLAELAGEPV